VTAIPSQHKNTTGDDNAADFNERMKQEIMIGTRKIETD